MGYKGFDAIFSDYTVGLWAKHMYPYKFLVTIQIAIGVVPI